jgi:hypothetical protein
MALAGLVALGAAALWHQSPNRPPLLVADSASPSECRAWHERARMQERHREGWLAIFEGFSTLQGLCHPQDIARGRASIEGALAGGLDPTLAIDYMMALRKVGETHAAEEWALLSVFVYMQRAVTTALIPIRSSATSSVVDPAIRAFTSNRSWQKELADIEHLLSRPPRVPAAEAIGLDHLIGRLSRHDRIHADYLRYRAHELGRLRLEKPWQPALLVSNASRCGHPDAIRAYGQMALGDQVEARFSSKAVSEVAWLHRRRTRQEGDLLVALLTKFGSQSWLSAGEGSIAFVDGEIVRYCAPLKHFATPLFPGD